MEKGGGFSVKMLSMKRGVSANSWCKADLFCRWMRILCILPVLLCVAGRMLRWVLFKSLSVRPCFIFSCVHMLLSMLGSRLEVVDRELAFLDRDAQRKLEAFEKARTVRVLSSTERKLDESFLAAELYYIFKCFLIRKLESEF